METAGLIALDTNIFIYVLENNPDFGKSAANLLRSVQGNGSASTIVYLELLSSSVFHQRDASREMALHFLNEQRLEYVEVTKEVLVLGAQLRAASPTKIDLGDAVHLASALEAGAEEFITNDQDLVKLHLEGLKITSL